MHMLNSTLSVEVQQKPRDAGGKWVCVEEDGRLRVASMGKPLRIIIRAQAAKGLVIFWGATHIALHMHDISSGSNLWRPITSEDNWKLQEEICDTPDEPAGCSALVRGKLFFTGDVIRFSFKILASYCGESVTLTATSVSFFPTNSGISGKLKHQQLKAAAGAISNSAEVVVDEIPTLAAPQPNEQQHHRSHNQPAYHYQQELQEYHTIPYSLNVEGQVLAQGCILLPPQKRNPLRFSLTHLFRRYIFGSSFEATYSRSFKCNGNALKNTRSDVPMAKRRFDRER